jgi:hypothetical protein
MNNKGTKSPSMVNQPFIRQIVLGNETPDVFTRISFRIHIALSFMLLFWSVVSWLALRYGWKVQFEKGLNVMALIKQRAIHYNFTPEDYLNNLCDFHLFSILAWCISLFSAVLLYRKKSFFLWLMLMSHAVYISAVIALLGLTFYLNEISWIEQLSLLILELSGWVIYLLQRQERRGNAFSFFSESAQE